MTDCPPELVERFRAELERLTVRSADRIGLAVSGGPDSLALLLLAHAAYAGRVQAATVDHQLRPESGAEADEVARICRDLDVPHRTLTASVSRAGAGLQAAAREARYAALASWMRDEGLSLLLTGHHADDQAETLLMRLLRGSGVSGLAGIRPSRPLPEAGPDARLCRPLLDWRRSELTEIVRVAGLQAADDPSNRNEAFDRTRIRLSLDDAPWLDSAFLARSAALLAEAEQALEWTAGRLFEERTQLQAEVLTFDPSGLPPELLRRLTLRCLKQVDPTAAPRGAELDTFVSALSSGGVSTLARVRGQGGPAWRFETTPPRRPS
ncbi:MAG TPA: tRNA lysidine(34) synthetase TilS [Allosphingosinicella sp.]|jgi:tRNA(Ile)-lysidine synthase